MKVNSTALKTHQ